jgi:hypothetical protein
MEKLAERPPYISFEMRPVEDRAATLAADDGLPKYKDTPFVIITPPGSKDQIEREASFWFEEKAAHVREGRWPAAWHTAFKEAYAAWTRDEEPPANGFSIRDWPALTKSQFDSLRNLRIMTVEDVAAMNEEAIGRLGMGGRALKQRAAEFLTTAKDTSAASERNAALVAEVASLKAQIAALTAAVKPAPTAAAKAP